MEEYNAYIERQIGNVQSYLTANYEPLYLENLDDLHSLMVQGVSSFELIGRPQLKDSENILKSKAKMVFKQLVSEADLNKEVWPGFIVTGRLYSIIEGMELLAKFIYPKSSDRATLDKVVVTKWGSMKVNLVGGNMPNTPEFTIIEYAKKDIPKVIETVFKKVLLEYAVECPPWLL